MTCDLRNGNISKIEFDVDVTCESCSEAVQKALQKLNGVNSVTIDIPKQSVVVETTLPFQIVAETIESTGKRAVLKGYGAESTDLDNCAVAEMRGSDGLFGVVRFFQVDENSCIIDGTIDGLNEGEHGLHIHELGDLSKGCDSLGPHYNPTKKSHGGRLSNERHYGDLGNIVADCNDRASFKFIDHVIKVWDIIGRSLAVTANKDDLGTGNNTSSKFDGNSGKRLACAIIARSAGLFENPKRLCQCDGVNVWDERNVPVAGESRSARKAQI